MDGKLSGKLFQELQDVLLSAFPDHDKLEQMIRYQLDENLSSVAGNDTLSTVTFNLIKWAESSGRLDDLIQGARTANPGNRALLIFEENYKKRREVNNTKFSISSLDVNWAVASLPLRPAFAHAQSHELHWADRKRELQTLVEMWGNGEQRVAGIIGWGGVGKSTLARRWYDELYKQEKPPDGFFWWSFYYQPSLDSFLESALLYLTGGNFRPADTPSPWVRVQQLVKVLSHGRFAIVLDGLEVMQETQNAGDNFGCMQDKAFRNLLELCADQQAHQSVMLVTSRFPLTDLQRFSGYSYLNISLDVFSEEDGAEYLEQRGVRGNLSELRTIVKQYGGHALSLSTLAGYLTEYFDGDAKEVAKIPYLATSEKTRINQILIAYNERLTAEQRAIMSIVSTCRRPPSEKMLLEIINIGKRTPDLSSVIRPLLDLDIFSIKNLITNLEKRSLIYRERNHLGEWGYNSHLMIREFFYKLILNDFTLNISLNKLLLEYSAGKPIPENPDNLNELTPLFDIVFYSCRSGLHDEGMEFYRNRLSQWQLGSLFGAYEFQISLLSEFFPDRNISNLPELKKPENISFLYNEIGSGLDKIGRTEFVVSLAQRAAEEAIINKDYQGAAISYQGLSGVLVPLGRLSEAKIAANRALEWAQLSNSRLYECNSLAILGWADFLLGNIDSARVYYQQANAVKWSENPEDFGLFSVLGVEYSTFLLMTGQIDESEKSSQRNLQICQKKKWQESMAYCHRMLGDVNLYKNNYSTAYQHCIASLEISQNLGLQEQFALSLLGISKVSFFTNEISNVHENLTAAQKICVESSYLIAQADILNFWAYVDLSQKQYDDTVTKAKSVLSIADNTGYIGAKATALHTLGNLELFLGNQQNAKQFLEDAYKIRKRISDPRAEETLGLLSTLQS